MMPKFFVCEDQECDEPHEQTHVERLQHLVSDHWKNILIGGLSEIIIVSFAVLLTYFLARQPICETELSISSTLPTSTSPIPTKDSKSSQMPISSTLSTPAAANYFCAVGFTYINNKCWKFITDSLRRADADQACFNHSGSTLFSIRNDQENQAVLEFVKNEKVENMWTGLICNRNDAFSCTWDVQSGTTADYNNFVEDNPNGECIYYMTTGAQAGKWGSGSCNETMNFMCELPTTVHDETCEYNYDSNCYFPHKSFNLMNTSSEAQNICASSGSNSVSVHSANENRFLMSIMPTNTIYSLGGVAFSDDLILWYDGTQPTFINTISFKRGNCLFLYNPDGHWLGYDCLNDVALFVCKKRIS